MHFLPVLFVSIAISAGKVIPNVEHQKQLEDVFGLPLDLNIVNDIINDEAKKLGIPAPHHFQNCLLDDDMINQKNQGAEGMEEFLQQVGKMQFPTFDSVMDEFKAKAPKAHAAFTMAFKETIASLGKEAAAFAVNLKEALIKVLYEHVSRVRNTGDRLFILHVLLPVREARELSPAERSQPYGKAVKKVALEKIFAAYDSLSDSAKVDLEKNTCFRTTMRIADATGEQKGKITEIKGQINDLMECC